LAAISFEIDPRRRQLESHVFHGLGDDLRNGQVAEPLVVGGNDVPGRVLAAGLAQRLFVGFDVVGPELALGVVAFADFPVARRVVEPLLEALELLLGADVQEELEDARAVLRRAASRNR
jgi:hypothetical protein